MTHADHGEAMLVVVVSEYSGLLLRLPKSAGPELSVLSTLGTTTLRRLQFWKGSRYSSMQIVRRTDR